jgi:hypothetical protein
VALRPLRRSLITRSFSSLPIHCAVRGRQAGVGALRAGRAGEPRAIASPPANVLHLRSTSKGVAMVRRALLCTAALCLLAALAHRTADAQGPQEWIKRILDPATIGVTMPSGAVMNRKLTVDYLSKADPPKEIAIYVMPLEQLKEASAHFKSTLKVEPKITGSGEFEIHRFEVTSGKAKGLSVMLTRSQFVDNKLQITMEYLPSS